MLSLGTHDPSVIDADIVVGHRLSHGIPVVSREVRPDVLEYARGRIFRLRCRSAELIESCDRGIEVCVVEDLSAVDHVVRDRENRDPPPLGV